MKTALVAVLLSLLYAIPSYGQTSNFGAVQVFSGVPTGTCLAGQLAVNSSNGNLYSCNAGSWALITGGSGTPCVVTALSLQFNSSGAFGCLTEWTYTGGILTASAAAKLDLSAGGATTFKVPVGAGLVPTVSGNIGYDSTANKWVFGQNAATVSFGLSSSACAANSFVSTPATGTAAAACTQPAFSNLSGTATAAQLGSAHNILVALGCADSSASGTAQVCNTIPTFTPVAGDCITYTTTTANTGTGLTLNVNSLGAKSVAKWQGLTTLAANDVLANKEVLTCYDGTNWELHSIGNAPLVNPMTTLGDTIFENSTPAIARLAGPTTPNSVAEILTSTPSGGVAQAPAWALPGVSGRTVTTTDTVLATDRSTWLVFSSSTAFTETLPQANSAGFTSNFSFCYINQGAGQVTITPTTSTIDGAASILVPSWQGGCVSSADNTNYLTRRSENGVVAAFNNTAQTANVAAATNQFAVPTNQGGFYRVTCYNVVTTAGTTSTMPSCQAVWTDDDANVAVAAVTFTPTSTGNTVGATNSVACPATCTNATNNNQNGGIVINAKAGTNIQVPTTGYASSGTVMQYANHVKIEYLGRSSN